MALLFVAPNRDFDQWRNAFREKDPALDIYFWPEIDQHKKINFIVCWNHPSHLLNRFPNLQVVASLGAGVDHILNDEALPDDVKICRTLTPRLQQEMVDYVHNAVMMHQRNIPQYLHQQRNTIWEPRNNRVASEVQVGVMGLGAIGKQVAKKLGEENYQTRGWSRSSKTIENVTTYAGEDEKEPFLKDLNVLVCLLPLTSETEGILELDLFKQLKNNALLVNIARGEHLVEEDLIYALDSDQLGWAMLDVFNEEPLPEQHPFWNRPEVIITPHIAGITPADEAAGVIIENYKRAISGMELKYSVQPERGY